MVIVSLFAMFAAALVFDHVRLTPRWRYFFLFALLAVVWLVGSLRWNTGNDWVPYFEFFARNSTAEEFWDFAKLNGFEWGYVLLNIALRPFESYTLLLFVLTAATIGLKSLLLISKRERSFLILFLYFSYYFADLVAVRQSIAMSFVCISFIYIEKKDPARFMICILAALAFHNSAAIFLPAYPVFHYLNYKHALTVALISGIVMVALGRFFIPFILNFISSVFPEFLVLQKLAAYTNPEYATLSSGDVGLSLILGVLKKITLLPLFLFSATRLDASPREKGIFSMWLFGVSLYLVLTPIAVSFQRLSTYYLFFEIFLIASAGRLFRGTSYWFFIFGVIIYCALKVIQLMSLYDEVFEPYLFVFGS